MDITSFLIKKGYVAIPIKENASGHLITEAFVNGVPGIFIVDTGAGTTVIDREKADLLKLELQIESASNSGAGAGGLGLEVIPAEGNKVEFGEYILNDFMLTAMSFEHVNQSLIQIGAEEITGVIGVDILKPGKAIIDFHNMLLYLMNPDKMDSPPKN